MKNLSLSFNSFRFFCAGICFLGASGFSEETGKKEDLAQVSEALGHLIGKNLQSLGLSLDVNALIRGIALAAEGKECPLSEEDCMEAINDLQQHSFSNRAEENLKSAELFLKENEKKEGIVSLTEGKLQYQVMKSGSGKVIQAYNKPLVRYSGKSLNGSDIAEAEELLDLDEAILGLKEGLIGMKEGEVRTLFIHPEFGYCEGPQMAPNSLLIFEVEVIKADTSSDHQFSKIEKNPLEIGIDRVLR